MVATNGERVLMDEAERALGGAAITSLSGRGLLRGIEVPSTTSRADATLRLDRVSGVIAGLAAGNALGRTAERRQAREPRPRNELADAMRRRTLDGGKGRGGASTQTFVLSAEAWLEHGWRAPEVLAEQLDLRLEGLRSPGRAIRTTVDELRRGTPWFLAAPRSYGDAGLSRAAAVGVVWAGDPRSVGLAASLDASVTHASKTAAASSTALAGLVAGLVNRERGTRPAQTAAAVIATIDHAEVRTLLESVLGMLALDPGEAARAIGIRPHAPNALALALWCASAIDDPATAIATAAAMPGDAHTTAAVAGAIVGAIHGSSALPARWVNETEGADAFRVLARRIASHTAPDDRRRVRTPATTEAGADIWFLLDRSGSMASIAEDVVAGFDRFFAEQRAIAGDATVSIVQFDGEDPHDVLVDARPLKKVRSIADRFEPRGMTPLYDAVGLLLDRAEDRGGDDADQLVVILTDGCENASHRWDQRSLFKRISRLQARGWTFVFLGANQDSYDAGAGVGLQAGNVSNFRADAVGVAASYTGLSRTVGAWRQKGRVERHRDKDDFWAGRKEAEEVL